ncbi:MAG: sigma 54-interacting transcriptional regulator [Planctomycetaceae bacterium]|nr:sigma 54-interacting transcriptional regulator [Planctomycetaceae bacterium]
MDRASADINATASAAWLLMRDQEHGERRFPLLLGVPLRIGRASDSGILLTDSRCSREHCEVFDVDGRWHVRDLGSRNGTFVDYERVAEAQALDEGDEIQLGPHRLIFTHEAEAHGIETVPESGETADEIPVSWAPLETVTPIKPRRKPLRRPAPSAMDSLVGESESIQRLREQIRRIAPTDATALIRGESGVGKELVARSLHELSLRQATPFVCLNCAALSESLLESELFGHEKGSFTGATDRKLGKFELAHGGTLFLDEIGELSQAIQAKFLRVLEGQPFHRIGGSDAIQADVRVLAATNRDLEEAVKERSFREDLYFRLNVVQITVDPLRSRSNDIALLAQHFLREAAAQSRRPRAEFSPQALERLLAHRWPGNVRELKNTIYRAVILARGDRLEPADIDFYAVTADDFDLGRTPPTLIGRSLQEVELAHIVAVLEQTGWNKSRASDILGIERSTLDRKLKRHDIQRPGGDRTPPPGSLPHPSP